MTRTRVQVPSWVPGVSTYDRIEVSDDPIASNLDAMQREWDLGRLQDRLQSLEVLARQGRTRVDPTRLDRLRRAIKQVQDQLAVWKVHQS
jgi:hypothetical protein